MFKARLCFALRKYHGTEYSNAVLALLTPALSLSLFFFYISRRRGNPLSYHILLRVTAPTNIT